MERGDEGKTSTARAGWCEHLAGEKRADGVRDGVVDVEEIERVELGDLGHARGEGEVVGRVLEERIVGDGDFVEVDVGFAAGEAEGLRVGDEVDLVAAGGEFDAELGGDDAGAAVGGIAGDADLHGNSYAVRGLKAAVMDERGGVWLRETCGDGREESAHLDVAVGAEACGDAVEVVIVVAGMADELEGAFGREGVEDLRESGGIEVAGGGDADGAVGGEDAEHCRFVVGDRSEGRRRLRRLIWRRRMRPAWRELLGEGGFEGVADGADGAAFESVEEGGRRRGRGACACGCRRG